MTQDEIRERSVARFLECEAKRAEALHLAFHNAFIVLDGGSDAAHRTYGCLYGLEMYAGQDPRCPIVPSAVSTVSALQKLSGLMIFLFGLALRNMLKVK